MPENVSKEKAKALVERKHPEYDNLVAHWTFLDACYKGGRAWFKDNIFRYIKEGDTEYNDRVDRAYRFNHTREIVDLVNKYIFKAKVVRNTDDAPEHIKDFWDSATKNRLSIEQYMRQVSAEASTLGRIWIVVDNNASGREIQTVKEQKEANIRTYSYIVKPQDVVDMSYDDEGLLNWILYRGDDRDDLDPFDSSGDIKELYHLWTTESWYVIEKKIENSKVVAELIDSGDHDLGVVPVFKHDNVETDDLYSSPALIGDIAYLDRAVANYLSNLDAIIQDQAFSQLCMPAQGLMPGEEGYDKLIEMGTKRIFTYDGEGGAKPHYLSPDPKQAELIIMVVQKIINEIYHSVGMAGERTKEDNSMGIDNSSGVAKAYDFERVNALLASKADSLDTAEEKMLELVNLWNGIEDGQTDYVKYSDEFDIRGLADEFDVAQNLSLMDAPETVRREQMKVVVDKLFPRLSKELANKIKEELENWPSKPVENSSGAILDRAKDSQSQNGTGDQENDQR